MPLSFGTSQQSFLSNGTFTVPSGVTSIVVECWGGGGSGGKAVGVFGGTKKAAGGGGGGGAYARSTLTVTPGATYTVNVGASQTTSGTDGNDTWFGSVGTVLAKGGGAGGNKTEVSGEDTIGNYGVGASTSTSIGTVKYFGGDGSGYRVDEVIYAYNGWSGAGGGGAGNAGNGTSADWTNNGVAGSGGAGFGGAGATGVTTGNTGNSGATFGGGGSGGHTRDITIGQRQGGSGAQGTVTVWWTAATNPVTQNLCTTCNPIISGCYLYTSAGGFTTPAPDGYYYSGSTCYQLVDGYVI